MPKVDGKNDEKRREKRVVDISSGVNFNSFLHRQDRRHQSRLPELFNGVKSIASQKRENKFLLPVDKRSDKTDIERSREAEESRKKEDALARRAAMQAFLKKMKEELGIDASQIMLAFSKLDINELMMSPEKTVGKILNQIELSGKQREKALFLFQDMLRQPLSGEIINKRQGTSESKKIQGVATAWNLERNGVLTNFSTSTKGGSQTIPEGMERVNSSHHIDNNQIGLNEKILESMTKNNQNFRMREAVSNKTDGEFFGTNFNSEITEDMETLLRKSNMQSATKGSGDLSEGSQSVVSTSLGLGGEKSESEGNTFQMGADESGLELSLQSKNRSENTTKGEFVINSPKEAKAQEVQNLREVIDQARVMIRNGGGEMKIKMNPEGMGEVTLKVATDDGRVNVEMIASNMDTKKLLEKGLADLKANLASHKLSVDLVKVASAEQSSKHMDQQLQEQQQGLAQQFMNEFQQNNQSWREGFIGLPGARFYKSQTQDEVSNQESVISHEAKQKKSGRRLDLVA